MEKKVDVILIARVSSKGKPYIACYTLKPNGEWVLQGFANSTNISNTLTKFNELKGGK